MFSQPCNILTGTAVSCLMLACISWYRQAGAACNDQGLHAEDCMPAVQGLAGESGHHACRGKALCSVWTKEGVELHCDVPCCQRLVRLRTPVACTCTAL